MVETVNIGIIGDFDPESITHKATNGALHHCALVLELPVSITWIPTAALEEMNDEAKLEGFHGLLCAPGSPYDSMEGALNGICFARENHIPMLGTCGGFQHIVLEYARNVLGILDADHEEYNEQAEHLFISRLVCSLAGKTLNVFIKEESELRTLLKQEKLVEKYYCNFGINPAITKELLKKDLEVVGTDENEEIRILSLKQEAFFYATLFVPQASSTREHPNPIILAFLNAAAKMR